MVGDILERGSLVGDGKTYPSGVNWALDIENVTPLVLIDRAVEKYPDHIAMDFLGSKTTYRELDERADQAAAGFQAQGLKKGDRVAIYDLNTPWYPVMTLGALRAGLIVTTCDITMSPENFKKQIEDSGAKLLVTTNLSPYFGKARDSLSSGTIEKCIVTDFSATLPPDNDDDISFKMRYGAKAVGLLNAFRSAVQHCMGKIVYADDFMQSGKPFTPVDVKPDDIAFLQYTSGTTGEPKGAILTHANMSANVQQCHEYLFKGGQKSDHPRMIEDGKDSMLNALPFNHIFPLTVGMLAPLAYGLTMNIIPNPRDIKTVMKYAAKSSVNPHVPRLLLASMEHPDFKSHDFSNVKFFISGGAPLEPRLKAEFEKASGTVILQGYGLSETAPVVAVQTPSMKTDANSTGHVVPQTKYMLAEIGAEWDENGMLKPAPEGEEGELVVSGPQVMQGYWNKPDDTAQVLRNRCFRTGDAAVRGANGEISITGGRIKDMIIINGKKVFPVAVEKKLRRYPDIVECNMVGVPDLRSGEAGVAFIRFEKGKTPPDQTAIREFFSNEKKSGLSHQEQPKHIVFWSEDEPMPQAGVGKPDKKALRAKALEMFAPKPASLVPAPVL